MKYEIWKFTKKYAKAIAENARKEIDSLEIELKHLKTHLKNYQTSQKYLDCKSNLDGIHSKKDVGVRIRSKYDLYETGEKSNKFFLNFEKTRASEGLICTFVENEKEINNPVETRIFIKSSSPISLYFKTQRSISYRKFALPKLQ